LYLFDCLYLGGFDLRALPLSERRTLLLACQSAYFAAADDHNGRIRLSEHIVGQGPEFFARACELGAEGSVCKRADAPYKSGRHPAWLKVKCTARQEFVIGGYSEPKASRAHVGALLLGLMEDGELKYAGRVGTGFSERSLLELKRKLTPLERAKPAYANPPRGADARDVHWVEPKLVAEVEYAQRTTDGLVRHAAFRGLREDKPAQQVQRETPVAEAPPDTTRAAHGGRRKHVASASKATKDERGAVLEQRKPREPHEPRVALPALRHVRLTHPERVLFPELQVTKADLALYYAQVAERMLPHLARRPLMLVRCPEGQGSQCFHQKHPTAGMSRAIKRHPIEESAGTFEAMYVEDAEGLVQLVQNGALEVHAWGSRIDAIEHADQLTFDLDPGPDVPWSQVVRAAQHIEQRLTALELPSFLKTTGGKGLHIVVPIAPQLAWDEVKAVCKSFAESFVRAEPARYSANLSKAGRKDKILIDYLRNGRGATAACAYSTRAKAGAPVATPIAWSELSTKLHSDAFSIRDVAGRLAKQPDPWAEFPAHRPKLTAALRRELAK